MTFEEYQALPQRARGTLAGTTLGELNILTTPARELTPEELAKASREAISETLLVKRAMATQPQGTSMKRLAERLLKVCLFLAIISLFGFAVIGAIQIGVSSDGVIRDGKFLSLCGLLFVFAIAIGLCGSVLDVIAERRATKAARMLAGIGPEQLKGMK